MRKGKGFLAKSIYGAISLNAHQRWMAFVICVALVAGTLPALAGVPEGARMVEGPQRLRGNVMPLDDGGWLVSGRGQRPAGIHWYERPDEPARMDDYGEIGEGYMARLDAQGEALWVLRFGDNSAQNAMYARGFFPDGRLLALFQSNPVRDSGMGSQLFVVNMESGHVDGMLPSAKLEAMGPLASVAVLPDGYVVGGQVPSWIAYYREHNPQEPVEGVLLRRLDAYYREIWALDLGVYSERPNFQALLLANGDILLYGYEQGMLGDAPMEPAVLRVNGEDGTVRWRYGGEQGAGMGRPLYAFEEADGGLVLLGEEKEPQDGMPPLRMTRIEADHLRESSRTWTAPIHAAGNAFPTGMARLGNGYVLAVKDSDTRGLDVLYINGKGAVLDRLAVIAPEAGTREMSAGFTVKASPDGTRVTLSGTLYERDVVENISYGSRMQGIWYMDLTEDIFDTKGQ